MTKPTFSQILFAALVLCCVLFVAHAQTVPVQPKVQQWEYRVEQCKAKQANEYGSQGWELAATEPFMNGAVCWFKRPKQ